MHTIQRTLPEAERVWQSLAEGRRLAMPYSHWAVADQPSSLIDLIQCIMVKKTVWMTPIYIGV